MTLDILFKYFDKDLPVIHIHESPNNKKFMLFGHTVSIDVSDCLPTVPDVLASQTQGKRGCYISLSIDPGNLEDVGIEFFVFEEALRSLFALIRNTCFDYLCFNCEHNVKIVTAIAQRLTKLIPNVEHMKTFNPFILLY